MNTPEISIIVPIYRVERYLQRCIDSVLSQTYQNWELILVDDGSPDRCHEIADEASLKDERIKVIHKNNGGLPSARLAGFELSQGTYVMHVDSDDWLLPNALNILYDEINKGYDIVRSLIISIDSNGKKTIQHYKIEKGQIFGTEKYQVALYKNDIAPYLHSAIYKKTLFSIEDFNKIVNAKISIGEDWVTNLLISNRVKSISIIDVPTYAYFKNHDSMMQSSVVSRDYSLRIDEAIRSFVDSSAKEIKILYGKKIVEGKIIKQFIPELGFSLPDYKDAREYLKSGDVEVESKYLLFINHLPLFYIYTTLYRLFFRWVRLKKVSRRIIR